MFKQQTNFPVKAIKVDSDKFSRASAITSLFETGRVYLKVGRWNQVLINQMCEFNALLDSPDDIVDAISQALNYCKSSQITTKPVTKKKNLNKIVRKHKILTGY
jgi:predicted phage terminase large subunit-like protein